MDSRARELLESLYRKLAPDHDLPRISITINGNVVVIASPTSEAVKDDQK